jgi:hypothetical protein
MKVTTTFSCSRTRRSARTQKGLMCPSIRNVKSHGHTSSDECNSYPKLEEGKIEYEKSLSMALILFKV